MGRLYLLREGFTLEDDILPARVYQPVADGPIAGKAMTPQMLSQAVQIYFQQMGWDERGVPGRAALEKLDMAGA
jgi:aldehyde:ferredoxin oxidoreductase